MSTKNQKLLVAGNWKMNNSRQEAVDLITDIQSEIKLTPEVTKVADFLVSPAFVHISDVSGALDTGELPITLAGQDCSFEDNGAHTGDVSAVMLSDMGCSAVILGHSERRQNHGEESLLVAQKAERAHGIGLMTIICVGETLEERESGSAVDVVCQQLSESLPKTSSAQNIVVAYEPVWAIGTGRVASPEDVKDMHFQISNFLKEKLDNGGSIRILYGGSVKPDNAGVLSSIEHVDGFLIGGASLKASSFVGIAREIRER